MSDRLNKLDREINQSLRVWNLALIQPYSEAYSRAYTSHQTILVASNRPADRNAELAVLTAAVVPGSLFVAILGSLTLHTVIRDAALRQLVHGHLQTTYRHVRDLAADPTTTFAVGRLIEEASSSLGRSVSAAITRRSTLLPNWLSNSPDSMRAQMHAQWDLQATILTDAAEAIEKDDRLSAAEKDSCFALLSRAPLLAGPSTAGLDIGKLAQKLELAMFMKHLLDLDTGSPQRGNAGDRPPLRAMSDPSGISGRGIHDRAPSQLRRDESARLAPAVSARIELLHEALFGAPFFGSSNGPGRAERGGSGNDLTKVTRVLGRIRERSQPSRADAIVSV